MASYSRLALVSAETFFQHCLLYCHRYPKFSAWSTGSSLRWLVRLVAGGGRGGLGFVNWLVMRGFGFRLWLLTKG